jgi:hypothetical protein
LTYQQRRRMWLCMLVLTLATSIHARAVTLDYSARPTGNGLFEYSLFINNTDGTEPIAGLNIVNGFGVFGLTSTAAITAPQNVGGNPAGDWFFFAPNPGLGKDELNYFSTNPAGDVPVGATVGGFSFTSITDPGALPNGLFGSDVVLAILSLNVSVITQPIPEPPSGLLVAAAAIIAGYVRRRRNCV